MCDQLIIEEFMICSFCLKERWQVFKLISGQFGFICNECVDYCNKILFNDNFSYNEYYNIENYNINNYNTNQIKNITNEEFLDGLMKPSEIYEFLDNLVIGQEETKKILSLSVYNHFKRLKFNLCYGFELSKSNILMIGPSGSGKTFLIKNLCKLLNIAIIITDATTLTEAGYVGEDVESILQKLFQESDYDIDKTEMGIIYIDEIDKISRKNTEYGGGRDVSGEGVQQALLKLIEGTNCTVCVSGSKRNPNPTFTTINTDNILFICGGAFYGLDKIISERISKSSIGFNSKFLKNLKNETITKHLECEDLVKFGLIPELIGRLPIIAKLNELDLNALINILIYSKNSILNEYNILLSVENVVLKIDEDAAEIIAKLAYKRKTGARGLRTIVENLLVNVMYAVPDLDTLKEILIYKYVLEKDNLGTLLIHNDF